MAVIPLRKSQKWFWQIGATTVTVGHRTRSPKFVELERKTIAT